jgi:plasmid replication initiation protein
LIKKYKKYFWRAIMKENHPLNTAEYLHVAFNKKLNKQEHFLLLYILNRMENGFYITLEELKSITKMANLQMNLNIVKGLFNKKINYSLIVKNQNLEGEFSVISSYFFDGELFHLNIAKELLPDHQFSLLFKEIHLPTFIKLRQKGTLKIYEEFVKTHMESSKLIFDIDELKDLLDVNDKYSRFFDFEKYIFKKILDEINRFSEYQVSYRKIKKGEGKTNRVIALEFEFINKEELLIKKQTDELVGVGRGRINNFSQTWELIYHSIKKNGFEFTRDTLEYTMSGGSKNFEVLLRKSIEEKTVLILNKPIYEYSAIIDNTTKLSSLIYNKMISYNLQYSLNISFLNFIRKVKKINSITYKDGDYEIKVDYTDPSKGGFSIWKF